MSTKTVRWAANDDDDADEDFTLDNDGWDSDGCNTESEETEIIPADTGSDNSNNDVTAPAAATMTTATTTATTQNHQKQTICDRCGYGNAGYVSKYLRSGELRKTPPQPYHFCTSLFNPFVRLCNKCKSMNFFFLSGKKNSSLRFFK